MIAKDLTNDLLILELRRDMYDDWEIYKDYALEHPTKIPMGACKQELRVVDGKTVFKSVQQFRYIRDYETMSEDW